MQGDDKEIGEVAAEQVRRHIGQQLLLIPHGGLPQVDTREQAAEQAAVDSKDNGTGPQS